MTDIPPSRTRKEREYARHHQDILDAAVHLFAENGYYQTTMQMVAERSEFSVGYLYKHFPGKEQMYRELLDYHFSKLNEVLAQARDQENSPLDRIRIGYRMICGHFNHHPDFMRIYHEAIGDEACRVEEKKAEHHAYLEQELKMALDEGSLRPHDPSLLAAAIQGATKELFKEFAQRRDENLFDPLPDLIFSLLIDPLRT